MVIYLLVVQVLLYFWVHVFTTLGDLVFMLQLFHPSSSLFAAGYFRYIFLLFLFYSFIFSLLLLFFLLLRNIYIR
jgi:hypothetical protein